jgi:hypothetical protein
VQPHRWLRMDNPLPSIPRIGSVILSYASQVTRIRSQFRQSKRYSSRSIQHPPSARPPYYLPLTSGTISSSSPNAALLNIPSLASSILTIPCLQLLQRNRHIMRTTQAPRSRHFPQRLTPRRRHKRLQESSVCSRYAIAPQGIQTQSQGRRSREQTARVRRNDAGAREEVKDILHCSLRDGCCHRPLSVQGADHRHGDVVSIRRQQEDSIRTTGWQSRVLTFHSRVMTGNAI